MVVNIEIRDIGYVENIGNDIYEILKEYYKDKTIESFSIKAKVVNYDVEVSKDSEIG